MDGPRPFRLGLRDKPSGLCVTGEPSAVGRQSERDALETPVWMVGKVARGVIACVTEPSRPRAPRKHSAYMRVLIGTATVQDRQFQWPRFTDGQTPSTEMFLISLRPHSWSVVMPAAETRWPGSPAGHCTGQRSAGRSWKGAVRTGLGAGPGGHRDGRPSWK